VDATELKTLTYERDDGVAVVTLSRPDRLNAWTRRMEHEYRWALETAESDEDARVVVVTGAGRGFCAGADFQALDNLAGGQDYGEAPRETSVNVFTLAPRLSKPVIAAVNGPAAGVGFVLMCYADIRFAAAGAKLTTSFARLGLPAEHGVSWVLSRLVGPARAADLLFSSRVVLAEEAESMGLVNKVLPSDELLPHTMAYAKRIAADLSPTSLFVLKRQLWADTEGSLGDAVGRSVDLMLQMLGSADFKEGTNAFQAKRPPAFGPVDRSLWP
jgi:enoyl-CoA hydratase/carnithine racemase